MIRAGRLFDGKSTTLATNQMIVIEEDRIIGVGSNLQIPAGATVVDLSRATVLPGMIDTHVHLYDQQNGQSVTARAAVAIANAAKTLNAGFTTAVDLDSRGGYGTVDIRDAINKGTVPGPRLQVAGPALNQRAATPYPSLLPPFQEGFTEGKNVNSPWLGRAAVREAKLHGVDWIKIYTTQDFVGSEYRVFKPDGTLVNNPSLTLEEVQAIVDEAHRHGLKVACHTYGGEGLHSCIAAGVDATQHALDLDDESVAMLLAKKLPLGITIADLVGLEPGDLKESGQKNSRLRHRAVSVPQGAQGRRPAALCQRRRRRSRSARQAGGAVRIFRQVGRDAGAGVADGVQRRRDGPQLRLGDPSARSKRASWPI